MVFKRLRQWGPPGVFLLLGLALTALSLFLWLGPGFSSQVDVAHAQPAAEVAPLPVAQTSCGNGRCDPNFGEDCSTCEDDCGPCAPPDPCANITAAFCGDGYCCPGEDSDKCPEDCGQPGVCGDEEIQPGEACDGIGQDACGTGQVCVNCQCEGGGCGDGVWQPELGEQCEGGFGNCPAGVACTPNCTCGGTQPRCGDGIVNQASEACDDGNFVNGDGCSSTCQFEGGGCPAGVVPQCGQPGLVCPTGQVCNPLTCQCGGGGLCGNNVLNPGEQCDPPGTQAQCITGQICSTTCQCGGPKCGNGVVEPPEACDDGNNVDGDGCSAVCRPERACGDGIADPGEECIEPGLVCPEDRPLCNITNCKCEPGEPCDPLEEEGDGGQDGGDGGQDGGEDGEDGNRVPINGFVALVEGDGGDGGDGEDGGTGGGGGETPPDGIDPDGPDEEDCEEGDCLHPGAGTINTYGGTFDVPAVECCNADGTGCVLHVSAEITVYTAPDGSLQLCSSEFDRFCRPIPGDRCRPARTDEIPGGGSIPTLIQEGPGPGVQEITPATSDSSSGGLASAAPQTIRRPFRGYVCRTPSELCIDLRDPQAFQNTLTKPGYPTAYDSLVLWDCQIPDESETSLAIANNTFPPVITVPIFTTIMWTNTDQTSHTVTSDTGLFDSGPLAQGQSFSHEFNLFGEFPYYSQGEGGPGGEGMSGLVRVVPQCTQQKLTVKPGNRACAQCTGDWCGFGPGRPECALFHYDEMPELWQNRYDAGEVLPQGNPEVTDGVYALVCPAPPQGHVCIPIDDEIKALYQQNQLLLADCFSGDADDPSKCPLLQQGFTLESAGGQDYLCFEAGEDTGFEPSCGPHPDQNVNGCAFIAQGAGLGFLPPIPNLLGPTGVAGLPGWVLLLGIGLLLLLILIILLATRRRRGAEE